MPENLLVRCRDPERVVRAVETFRPGDPAEFTASTKWPLNWPDQPLCPTTLKVSPLRQDIDEGPDFRRYWATKQSDGGRQLEFEWILLVDESNRADPRLACHLSLELLTTCLAVHGWDGPVDEYGWCTYRNGELIDEFFREMSERPVYRVNQELELRAIPYKLHGYKDCSGPGWRMLALGH